MRSGLLSRRKATKAELVTLFLRQDGQCAGKDCGRRLSVHYHRDHVIPLALGGADHIDNEQLLCVPCHRDKTVGRKATTAGSDIHTIRKVERLANPKPKSKTRWPKRAFRNGK